MIFSINNFKKLLKFSAFIVALLLLYFTVTGFIFKDEILKTKIYNILCITPKDNFNHTNILARLYYKKGNKKKAKFYFNKANRIIQLENNKKNREEMLDPFLKNVCIELEELKNALNNMEDSLQRRNLILFWSRSDKFNSQEIYNLYKEELKKDNSDYPYFIFNVLGNIKHYQELYSYILNHNRTDYRTTMINSLLICIKKLNVSFEEALSLKDRLFNELSYKYDYLRKIESIFPDKEKIFFDFYKELLDKDIDFKYSVFRKVTNFIYKNGDIEEYKYYYNNPPNELDLNTKIEMLSKICIYEFENKTEKDPFKKLYDELSKYSSHKLRHGFYIFRIRKLFLNKGLFEELNNIFKIYYNSEKDFYFIEDIIGYFLRHDDYYNFDNKKLLDFVDERLNIDDIKYIIGNEDKNYSYYYKNRFLYFFDKTKKKAYFNEIYDLLTLKEKFLYYANKFFVKKIDIIGFYFNAVMENVSLIGEILSNLEKIAYIK